MIYGYSKLFSSIITSTIWREDLATKVVWITMLALKDRKQQVMASIPGLAHMAGVSKEDCHNSLTKLMLPDPDSRTKEAGGARIKEIDGGWFIINGDKYRDLMSEE